MAKFKTPKSKAGKGGKQKKGWKNKSIKQKEQYIAYAQKYLSGDSGDTSFNYGANA